MGTNSLFNLANAIGRNPRLVNQVIESVVKAADTSTPKLTVESIDNHVYFYADVDTDRCLALMREIRYIDARLRTEQLTREIADLPPTPIWLHIYSGGGDLFAGLNVADQLQRIQTPIYSIVEGLCASAATFISMACTRRYITPTSFMLIHQFSTLVWGKHEEFKDDMRLQEMMIAKMVAFYAARTDVTSDGLRELLKHDWWMDAEEAVKRGFVDEVR